MQTFAKKKKKGGKPQRKDPSLWNIKILCPNDTEFKFGKDIRGLLAHSFISVSDCLVAGREEYRLPGALLTATAVIK